MVTLPYSFYRIAFAQNINPKRLRCYKKLKTLLIFLNENSTQSASMSNIHVYRPQNLPKNLTQTPYVSNSGLFTN